MDVSDEVTSRLASRRARCGRSPLRLAEGQPGIPAMLVFNPVLSYVLGDIDMEERIRLEAADDADNRRSA